MMRVLATAVLSLHLFWLGFVIFGAYWTRGRPFWTAVHLLALIWGIIVEVGPWPCPLTLAEGYFEARAGLQPLQGSFVLHLLDSIVYPSLPYRLVTALGVGVCCANLGIYLWRLWAWQRSRAASRPA